MRYPRIDTAGAVVLVTGGARGIGQATAALLAAKGAHVCVGDLDLAAAREAALAMRPDVHAYELDVTDRESFGTVVRSVLDEFGRIDVLVNNAGVMPLGGFLDGPYAASRATMEVNLWGPFHGMRLVLPHMVARGRGHVVNVTSMAGKVPIPGMAAYNASKFAATGLSAAVRAEFAGSGVSVSTVLPSAVRTRLSAGVPLGRGLPTVDAAVVARAVVGSLATRKAEITVPRYLAGWAVVDALVPERVLRVGRRLVRDRRALTSVDRNVRAGYERAITEQARPLEIGSDHDTAV
jgi:NAD(P)-dependent dehydrogenase (short-subunit alcohol dehydrogenase family)